MLSHALTMPWVIPTIFGSLVAIVAIVSNVFATMSKSNAETNLKKRMVDQGYSVADIERVVGASAHHCPQCGGKFSDEACRPAKPPKRPAGVL